MRMFLIGCALAICASSLSGCTLVFAGGGTLIGSARQPAKTIGDIPLVQTEKDVDGNQEPKSEPMSVRTHAIIGGALGFALDILVLYGLSQSDWGYSVFGCEGDPDC